MLRADVLTAICFRVYKKIEIVFADVVSVSVHIDAPYTPVEAADDAYTDKSIPRAPSVNPDADGAEVVASVFVPYTAPDVVASLNVMQAIENA